MSVTGTMCATFADGTTMNLGTQTMEIEIVSDRKRQRDEISDAEFEAMEAAIEGLLV